MKKKLLLIPALTIALLGLVANIFPKIKSGADEVKFKHEGFAQTLVKGTLLPTDTHKESKSISNKLLSYDPTTLGDAKNRLYKLYPDLEVIKDADTTVLVGAEILKNMETVLSNSESLQTARNVILNSRFKIDEFSTLSRMYWIDFLKFAIRWKGNPNADQVKQVLQELIADLDIELQPKEHQIALAGDIFEMLELQFEFDQPSFCKVLNSEADSIQKKIANRYLAKNGLKNQLANGSLCSTKKDKS